MITLIIERLYFHLQPLGVSEAQQLEIIRQKVEVKKKKGFRLIQLLSGYRLNNLDHIRNNLTLITLTFILMNTDHHSLQFLPISMIVGENAITCINMLCVYAVNQ